MAFSFLCSFSFMAEPLTHTRACNGAERQGVKAGEGGFYRKRMSFQACLHALGTRMSSFRLLTRSHLGTVALTQKGLWPEGRSLRLKPQHPLPGSRFHKDDLAYPDPVTEVIREIKIQSRPSKPSYIIFHRIHGRSTVNKNAPGARSCCLGLHRW